MKYVDGLKEISFILSKKKKKKKKENVNKVSSAKCLNVLRSKGPCYSKIFFYVTVFLECKIQPPPPPPPPPPLTQQLAVLFQTWNENTLFCPLLKGIYSKRKEFSPLGTKFFPFRMDFKKGFDVQ